MENKYIGIEKVISKEKIKYSEPMSNHTTMKVGGIADVVIFPTTYEDVINVCKYAKENNIKIYVFGNGSNILVKDEGIRGIVLKITTKFSGTKIEGTKVTSLAGTSVPKLAFDAKMASLSGLEFSCGIPGAVGGTVRMNAGAYGSEMSAVVEEVEFLDEKFQIRTLKNEELEFSYRHSIFADNKNYIILKVIFNLKEGKKEEIEELMKQNSLARTTKQPIEYPSAGSVFKRPVGYFVGKLVADSGLRGYMIGGAQVSEKHTGFIINKNNATCKDVLDLIEYVKKVVNEKFGVLLNTEVEVIGGEN